MRRRSISVSRKALDGEPRPDADQPLESTGKRSRRRETAAPVPTICMTMNMGADDGSMPAKVPERDRAMVTAGLAKLVDEVK